MDVSLYFVTTCCLTHYFSGDTLGSCKHCTVAHKMIFNCRGIKLNIATRVPIESLGDKLMSCVIGLCRDAETRIGMKYYNYCELQPASEVDNDRFFQLISYLTGNQSVSNIRFCSKRTLNSVHKYL